MFSPYHKENWHKLDGKYFAEMHPTRAKVISYGSIKAGWSPVLELHVKYLHGSHVKAIRHVEYYNMGQIIVCDTEQDLNNILKKVGRVTIPAEKPAAKPSRYVPSFARDLTEQFLHIPD